MQRNADSEGQRWLKQADYDYNDAVFVMNGQRYSLACFLAQQSAEKALKAFLYSQGVDFVWGHSVVELCTNAIEYDKSFDKLKTTGASLDTYYIPTRYPNGLPGGIPYEAYDKEDAKMALKKSKNIIEHVRNVMS